MGINTICLTNENLQNLIIIIYSQMHIKYYNAADNQSIPE